jgi:hypothetical protein
VARAIEKYDLEFNRLIFCGAIVRSEYPWTRMFETGRVNAILNDFGREDFWARIVSYFLEDAGQSGYRGFSDTAAGRLIQRAHPEFRHSDYFYERNYQKNWIPFLKAELTETLAASDLRPPNWRFRVTLSIICATLVILTIVGFVWYTGWFGWANKSVPKQDADDAKPVTEKNLSEELIGKTPAEARSMLGQKGMSLRVMLEDGKRQIVKMDLKTNRVNVEVRNGRIIRVLDPG